MRAGDLCVRNRQKTFIAEYLKDFNATQAAIRAGYSEKSARAIGSENLTKPDIDQAIKQAIAERTMQPSEILIRLSEQARGDLSVFFKIVEEWTFYPLPTYDIIDAKEVIDDSDPDKPKTRISYWVRHIAIDMEKVRDPKYSSLLHKFSDSPKNGIGIEIYNKQSALQILAKMQGMIVDKVDSSGTIRNVNVDLTQELGGALSEEERIFRIKKILGIE